MSDHLLLRLFKNLYAVRDGQIVLIPAGELVMVLFEDSIGTSYNVTSSGTIVRCGAVAQRCVTLEWAEEV